eukprot:g16822.t1
MGLLAKLAATLATYPLQIAQSRIRIQKGGSARTGAAGERNADRSTTTSSTFRILQEVYRNEGGFWAFYAGMEKKMLHSLLNSAFINAALNSGMRRVDADLLSDDDDGRRMPPPSGNPPPRQVTQVLQSEVGEEEEDDPWADMLEDEDNHVKEPGAGGAEASSQNGHGRQLSTAELKNESSSAAGAGERRESNSGLSQREQQEQPQPQTRQSLQSGGGRASLSSGNGQRRSDPEKLKPKQKAKALPLRALQQYEKSRRDAQLQEERRQEEQGSVDEDVGGNNKPSHGFLLPEIVEEEDEISSRDQNACAKGKANGSEGHDEAATRGAGSRSGSFLISQLDDQFETQVMNIQSSAPGGTQLIGGNLQNLGLEREASQFDPFQTQVLVDDQFSQLYNLGSSSAAAAAHSSSSLHPGHSSSQHPSSLLLNVEGDVLGAEEAQHPPGTGGPPLPGQPQHLALDSSQFNPEQYATQIMFEMPAGPHDSSGTSHFGQEAEFSGAGINRMFLDPRIESTQAAENVHLNATEPEEKIYPVEEKLLEKDVSLLGPWARTIRDRFGRTYGTGFGCAGGGCSGVGEVFSGRRYPAWRIAQFERKGNRQCVEVGGDDEDHDLDLALSGGSGGSSGVTQEQMTKASFFHKEWQGKIKQLTETSKAAGDEGEQLAAFPDRLLLSHAHNYLPRFLLTDAVKETIHSERDRAILRNLGAGFVGGAEGVGVKSCVQHLQSSETLASEVQTAPDAKWLEKVTHLIVGDSDEVYENVTVVRPREDLTFMACCFNIKKIPCILPAGYLRKAVEEKKWPAPDSLLFPLPNIVRDAIRDARNDRWFLKKFTHVYCFPSVKNAKRYKQLIAAAGSKFKAVKPKIWFSSCDVKVDEGNHMLVEVVQERERVLLETKAQQHLVPVDIFSQQVGTSGGSMGMQNGTRNNLPRLNSSRLSLVPKDAAPGTQFNLREDIETPSSSEHAPGMVIEDQEDDLLADENEHKKPAKKRRKVVLDEKRKGGAVLGKEEERRDDPKSKTNANANASFVSVQHPRFEKVDDMHGILFVGNSPMDYAFFEDQYKKQFPHADDKALARDKASLFPSIVEEAFLKEMAFVSSEKSREGAMELFKEEEGGEDGASSGLADLIMKHRIQIKGIRA